MSMTLFETQPAPPEVELLPIQGSEKQTPWAEAVRAGKLAKCREHLRKWRLLILNYEDAGRDDLADQERGGYRAAVDILAILQGQTAARFWIDRRFNDAAELLTLSPAKPGSSY